MYSDEMKSCNVLTNKALRLAIAYVFVECLDIPPPEEWVGRKGTITIISRTLNISAGSTRSILNVLQNVTTCLEEGMEYTGDHGVRYIRNSKKIMCGSVEAELIAKWMEEGLGFWLTTMFVNDHLKQEEKKEVSVKSVYNAFYCMKPLITRIEKKPKT